MTRSGLSRFGSLEDAWREIRRVRLHSERPGAAIESLVSRPVRSASMLAPVASLARRGLRRLLRPWLARQDETNRVLLERIARLEHALAREVQARRRGLETEREVARSEARAARRAVLELRRRLARGSGTALGGRTARLEVEAARQEARLAKLGDLLSIGNDAFLLLRRDGVAVVSEKELPEARETRFVAALAVSGDLRTGSIAAAHSRALAPRLVGCRRVVDLGCGTGEFLEELARAGVPAFGVDVDPEAVEACLRRGLEARVGDLFEVLASEELPDFDGVVLSHVIEHVGPVEALRLLLCIGARLPEGGTLLVVTPNPESLFTHLVHFWRDPTHVRPYPVELLRKFAEAAGFSVVEAGEVPGTAETAWAL